MSSKRRTHGTTPDGRLIRLYVNAAPGSSPGLFFGEIRRHINARNSDGTGYRSVSKTSQNGKKSVFFHTSAFARNTDEMSALGAALGVARSQPDDDLHIAFPTQQSLDIYRQGPRYNWKHPFPYIATVFSVAHNHAQTTLSVAHLDDEVMKHAAARLGCESSPARAASNSFIWYVRNIQVLSKNRSDCTCEKSKFASEQLAELSLLQLAGATLAERGYTKKIPVRAYQCPDSSWWHVTSKLVSHPRSPGE